MTDAPVLVGTVIAKSSEESAAGITLLEDTGAPRLKLRLVGKLLEMYAARGCRT